MVTELNILDILCFFCPAAEGRGSEWESMQTRSFVLMVGAGFTCTANDGRCDEPFLLKIPFV